MDSSRIFVFAQWLRSAAHVSWMFERRCLLGYSLVGIVLIEVLVKVYKDVVVVFLDTSRPSDTDVPVTQNTTKA